MLQIPSKSVAAVAMSRKGDRQPDEEVRLSSTIFTIDVSVMTAIRVGSDVDTSGSNSVTNPLGNGLELFTRRN
ncbi:MAG: hypothetical protein EA424_02275 [Planctomycetaceae bacterium]|nr:MAG: hypothetical protein EA424_02275 [Planctomycetaceae bacterium]